MARITNFKFFYIMYFKWDIHFGIRYSHAEKERVLAIYFIHWVIVFPIGNRSRRYSGLTDKVK